MMRQRQSQLVTDDIDPRLLDFKYSVTPNSYRQQVFYECEEDGTTTFYEGKSAEAGNPGIWTYVVYDCDRCEEEIVTNLDINTLDPALKLRQLVIEVIAATAIDSPDEQVQKLQVIARENGISPESLLSGTAETQRSQQKFIEAASYVLNRNAELYRRLA